MITRLDAQCRATKNLSELRIETTVSFPLEMTARSTEGESGFANTVKRRCSGETEPKGKEMVSMAVRYDEILVHIRKSLPRALRGHRVGLPRDRAPRGGVVGARRRGGEGEEGEEKGESFHVREGRSAAGGGAAAPARSGGVLGRGGVKG